MYVPWHVARLFPNRSDQKMVWPHIVAIRISGTDLGLPERGLRTVVDL